MANVANQNPLVFDTDFADFSAIGLPGSLPLKVKRISLVAGATPANGTVTVTDKLSGVPLLSPMAVAAAAAGQILFADDFAAQQPYWANFAVTGLTATGTKLYVWS